MSVPLDELMRLTAAEQDCCQFLTFAITVDTRGIGLEVTAPADALPIVQSLFGARRERQEGRRRSCVATMGNAVAMGAPQDSPDQRIRCFLIIDPNGIAINVTAPLAPARPTQPGG